MGSCHCCADTNVHTESASSRLISDIITQDLRREQTTKTTEYEIAIVGPSQSGKNTLLNQVDKIYHLNKHTLNADNAPSGEVKLPKTVPKRVAKAIQDIRQHCIEDLCILCEMVEDEKSMEALEDIETADMSFLSNEQLQSIAALITQIWNKQDIQHKYKFRHFYGEEFLLNDHMDYFWHKVNDIFSSSYSPSMDDILKHKSTNPSITTLRIELEEYTLNVSAAGTVAGFCELYGKQWHLFDHANVIVFMVNLSSYCVQDHWFDTNAMRESMRLFDLMVNSQYLRRAQITLVLNKSDVFQECLRCGISLKRCFPDYDGAEYLQYLAMTVFLQQCERQIAGDSIPSDVSQLIAMYVSQEPMPEKEEYFQQCYREGLEFIEQQFKSLCRDRYREIPCFVTNSMDTQQTEKLFREIQQYRFSSAGRH